MPRPRLPRRLPLGAEMSKSALAVGLLGIVGCASETPAASEWSFGPPTVVWERRDGAARGVAVGVAPDGRARVMLTALGGDGLAGVWSIERAGSGWALARMLPRPEGSPSEQLLAAAGATLLSRSDGNPASPLWLRRYDPIMGWGAPREVTQPGVERSRVASLGEYEGGVALAYSVEGGACTGGVEIRLRMIETEVGAPVTVAAVCSVVWLAVARARGSGATVVAWTGSGPTERASGSELWATWSSSSRSEFRTPVRVLGGGNSGVRLVALRDGRFVATWAITRAAADGGRRSAAFAILPSSSPSAGWSVPTTVWFYTARAPATVGSTDGAEVLTLGVDGEATIAPIGLWRWPSIERSLLPARSGGTSSGPVAEVAAAAASDGTLHAAWIEGLSGVQRVLHTAGARRP